MDIEKESVRQFYEKFYGREDKRLPYRVEATQNLETGEYKLKVDCDAGILDYREFEVHDYSCKKNISIVYIKLFALNKEEATAKALLELHKHHITTNRRQNEELEKKLREELHWKIDQIFDGED